MPLIALLSKAGQRDSSGNAASVFEAELRPQSGTLCLAHEGGTGHPGRASSYCRFAQNRSDNATGGEEGPLAGHERGGLCTTDIT